MSKSFSCEDLQTLKVELMMSDISRDDKASIDAHLEQCQTCQQEMSAMDYLWAQLDETQEQPSEQLRGNFYAMLSTQISKQDTEKRQFDCLSMFRRLWPQNPQWAMAYSLLLLVSGFLFAQISGPFGEGAKSPFIHDVSDIRDELDSLKGLVALTLLEQDSAQSRLQGVSYAQQTSGRDQRLLSSLMTVAAEDKTSNVRMAAIDALYAYQQTPELTIWAQQQLPHENSLLVQLKMAELILALAGSRRSQYLESLLSEDGLQEELKVYLRDQENGESRRKQNVL